MLRRPSGHRPTLITPAHLVSHTATSHHHLTLIKHWMTSSVDSPVGSSIPVRTDTKGLSGVKLGIETYNSFLELPTVQKAAFALNQLDQNGGYSQYDPV